MEISHDSATWQAYQGARSWTQLNSDSGNASDETCESCEPVRRQLVQAAVVVKTLVWLADASVLHTSTTKFYSKPSPPRRCGFCRIIHQQYWAWQSARYRLQSHLWASKVREWQADDLLHTQEEMKDLWDSVGRVIDEIGGEHFSNTVGNSIKGCRSCHFCDQDEHGRLPFRDRSVVCEPCWKVMTQYSGVAAEALELRPAVPLIIKPASNRGLLSVLRIQHAAGIRAPDSLTGDDWRWVMYTLPGERIWTPKSTDIFSSLSQTTQLRNSSHLFTTPATMPLVCTSRLRPGLRHVPPTRYARFVD
jgi:hypothetical protein